MIVGCAVICRAFFSLTRGRFCWLPLFFDFLPRTATAGAGAGFLLSARPRIVLGNLGYGKLQGFCHGCNAC